LLLTSDPAKYVGDALINWNIVRTMALACGPVEPGLICRQALIIDAIFGTGLDRPPREPFPALAEAINQSGNPVLAVDLPSGLDCDTGQPLGVCVKATRTVTFVAQKLGFANVESRPFTGRVIVGDIGCPRELIEQVLCDLPAT
jgi:NAD(P)H-hydrate epimerase